MNEEELKIEIAFRNKSEMIFDVKIKLNQLIHENEAAFDGNGKNLDDFDLLEASMYISEYQNRLEYINLSNCSFTEESFFPFVQAITEHPNIKEIYLSKVSF